MADQENSQGECNGVTVGILTGGGDCPGLNAAIRAVARRGMMYGWRVIGFRNGWAGVVERNSVDLGWRSVSGILQQGGTMLGTSRTDPRKSEESFDKVRSVFQELGLEALVAIGGDDTLSVAHALAKEGKPVVGLPKTMDNDVQGTDYCIGFDSAVTRVMEALDYLHTTAASHHRAMVVEVMGRHAGWVAAVGGLAGGADFIIVPETTISLSSLIAHLERRQAAGRSFSIIVVAEGAIVDGLELIEPDLDARDEFGHQLLGTKQIGQRLAEAIERESGMESRGLPCWGTFSAVGRRRYSTACLPPALASRRRIWSGISSGASCPRFKALRSCAYRWMRRPPATESSTWTSTRSPRSSSSRTYLPGPSGAVRRLTRWSQGYRRRRGPSLCISDTGRRSVHRWISGSRRSTPRRYPLPRSRPPWA